VFFINGRPLEQVVEVIDDLSGRTREDRPPLRFGLSAFVIAREDEADAHAEHDALLALAARDDRSRLVAGTDKAVAMMKVNAGVARVGTNGGTLAGLVGSYDQVAERIAAFAAAGIELFMLQFQPLEAEAERFGREVIPRVRALVPAHAA
jgi:alkanesulfonate monooxygenase